MKTPSQLWNIKSAARSLLLLLLLLLGFVAPGLAGQNSSSVQQLVVIDAARVNMTVDASFHGVNIDTQLIYNMAYGNETRNFLEDPTVLRLSAAFKGAVLRVGGSSDNHWSFVLPDGTVPGSNTSAPDSHQWLMTVEMWRNLYNFAKQSGLRLMLQLNAIGSRNRDRLWDPTNTIAFLRHIHTQGQDKEGVLIGFEFGNEPVLFDNKDRQPYLIIAAELTDAYQQLHSAMTEELQDGLLLQGPDSCCAPFDSIFFHKFVRSAHSDLNQVSVHFYPYSACQNHTCNINNFLSPSKLKREFSGLKRYRDEMRQLRRDVNATVTELPLVLSETAGASCGGCANITNAFAGSLWWVTYLGFVSTLGGYTQLYRQALLGVSDYSLVNTYKKRIAVNPDYFVSVLWRRLLGPTFLHVDLRGAPEYDYLHVFAACTLRASSNSTNSNSSSGKPALTVVFANWSPDPVDLTIEVMNADLAPGSGTGLGLRREEYVFTSDALESRQIRLNGAREWLTSPEQLVPKEVLGFGPVEVAAPGHSLGFIVVPDVRAPACKVFT